MEVLRQENYLKQKRESEEKYKTLPEGKEANMTTDIFMNKP
jgi:hypothetical protein